MTPLRQFKVKKKYTKGQVKELKKLAKNNKEVFKRDTTIYDVLAIECEHTIGDGAYPDMPTDMDVARTETGWDEEDEDELEAQSEKARANAELTSSTVIYLLIANPKSGQFEWVDVTQVKYIPEATNI
jgi:hypothetical protein